MSRKAPWVRIPYSLPWIGQIVVYSAALETQCVARHREFESHSIRHVPDVVSHGCRDNKEGSHSQAECICFETRRSKDPEVRILYLPPCHSSKYGYCTRLKPALTEFDSPGWHHGSVVYAGTCNCLLSSKSSVRFRPDSPNTRAGNSAVE